jgi:tetratricopeptide (TPR) repeat protein
MNSFLRGVLLVGLIFSFATSHAQTADTHLKKAKEYYDNDQYREALYHFKKFIALDQTNALVYKWRGNCYLEINQLDSAQFDYTKALSLDPSLNAVHYNLSLVYSSKKQYDLAERELRQYLKNDKEDPHALLLLSSYLGETKPDSASILIAAAYKIDSLDDRTIDAMIRDDYRRKDFNAALKHATRWRSINRTPETLVMVMHAAYGARQYELSEAWADSLIAMEPTSLQHRVHVIRCQIMQKTLPTIFKEGTWIFKELSDNNTALLDKLVKDPDSKYNYEKLLARFRASETLSTDEYFMVYYGFTTDSRYSPYGSSAPDVRKDLKEENYSAVIDACVDALKKDELNPALHYYLGIAQFRSGAVDDGLNSLKKYIGIMEGMTSTGSGATTADAIIVISTHEEYEVLSYFGYYSNGQALLNRDGHSFDRLSATDEEENKKDFYFNIDKPFGSLGNMFKDVKTPPEKSKKKKKDKKKND